MRCLIPSYFSFWPVPVDDSISGQVQSVKGLCTGVGAWVPRSLGRTVPTPPPVHHCHK